MSDKNNLTIRAYLAEQHVFTLCTSSSQDLWCASCFYVFDADSMAFWFMTEVNTRHGQLMQKNPIVAGTVAEQIHNVAEIKGVQFRGEVIPLTGEAEAVARKRYCHHFPVALASKSPIWQLNLNEIKMVDNTLGFGTKLHWQRQNN
ncbi:YhbP family protein [Xenorhabdus szentirmaii]|uniref:YhbP family protein n=1 Tax=Xenorhabdus szentirmaii TaxID=290112 RepID=UPI00199E3FA7|nr:YhbP family protein [Xenorhabdus sp. 38]MBD2779037.1 YhbP family protein [Xenorhabdus sp. 38]